MVNGTESSKGPKMAKWPEVKWEKKWKTQVANFGFIENGPGQC